MNELAAQMRTPGMQNGGTSQLVTGSPHQSKRHYTRAEADGSCPSTMRRIMYQRLEPESRRKRLLAGRSFHESQGSRASWLPSVTGGIGQREMSAPNGSGETLDAEVGDLL